MFAMNSVRTVAESYIIEGKDKGSTFVWIIVAIILLVCGLIAFVMIGLPKIKRIRYLRRKKKRQASLRRQR